MKKVSLPVLIVLSVTLGSCVYDGWNQGISGNGNVIEESRDVSGFNGVHVSSGIDVYLTEGKDFELRVEADENLMEVIVTELKGNILIVRTDRHGIRHAKSRKAFVTLPELGELKVSSAADCVGKTPFNCQDLELEVSSAGDLTLEVYADRIFLDISSSGDARLEGRTNFLDVSLSSAGDLHAFDLIAKKAEVDVSSAGDARVFAEDEISMNVSSAGNIYYMGDAKVVRSRTSSTGDIIKKN